MKWARCSAVQRSAVDLHSVQARGAVQYRDVPGNDLKVGLICILYTDVVRYLILGNVSCYAFVFALLSSSLLVRGLSSHGSLSVGLINCRRLMSICS